MLTHDLYMERAKSIRQRHRDKTTALYNVYEEKSRALKAEFEAQIAALEEERKAPQEEEHE